MRVCPLCQARYDDEVRKCPYDGRRPLPEAVVSAGGGDALLGATLAQRYTIVGRVGAGGMGTVYRAEQAPMAREVALKVLRKDLGRDPETVARFHREAHTLSQLKHPNTVTIFDFGQTDDGLLYLAMELLEGEMLSSRLKRVGPMDVPLSIRIAEGVLRSLAEAHTRGIIHRDLKPDNIFIARVHGRPEEDEVVKVVDFGIAKIRDGERGLEPLQTQEGTVFGTPRYMSPEQAQGKTLDGRSDLYAVGVLLFHMLTGHAPFTDDDAVVVMAHHIKTIPGPVRELAPGRPIPASLEAVVQRALEKDPIHRPQNAETFLADLEKTHDEARKMAAAALAPSVFPPAVVAAPPSRKRIYLGAAAFGLFAILAGLASATPLFRARPEPAVTAAATGAPTPAVAEVPVRVAATSGETPAPAPTIAPAGELPEAVEARHDLAPAVEPQVVEPAAVVPPAVEPGPAANPPRPGVRNASGNSGTRPRGTSRSHRGAQPYHRWSD